MVGPPLIPPDGSDPNLDYVPSAAVLATLPSSNPNLPDVPSSEPKELFDVEIPGPVLRAAAIPDIRILRGLLRHGFPATNYIVGPLYGPWESALTNAIRAGLVDHVRLLLEYGANPNGFPDWCFDAASTRFLRGRPHSETVTGGCYLRSRAHAIENIRQAVGGNEPDQNSALTDDELAQRRKSRSLFWAEPDFPRTNYPTNNPIPALSVAVKYRDKASYDLLIGAGADEAAWTGATSSLADDHTPSRWAVESPLWAATTNQDEDMLQFLLDRGHKPDHLPEALVTRNRNPLADAILQEPPWVAGFDMMAPTSDASLLTPLFRCHILHFAASTLNLSLMTHVIDTIGDDATAVLRQVQETTLGHTLLHVACLPLHDAVTNMHSEPIYLSIHEFRPTITSWAPQELLSEPPGARSVTARASMRGRGRGRGTGRVGHGIGHLIEFGPLFHEVPQDDLRAQAKVVLYLMQHLKVAAGQGDQEELTKQDVHGNTPLHYLAAIRNPDKGLIDELIKEQQHGRNSGRAWKSVSNLWDFTAEDLYISGEAARVDWDEWYMPFWKNG